MNKPQQICSRCYSIEKEIITGLQSTEEFKRSMAISEAFKFLLGKIKSLENDKSSLITMAKDYEEIISNQKIKSKENNQLLLTENDKLIQENECLKKEMVLWKNKVDVVEKLNVTLDGTIKEMEKNFQESEKKRNEKYEEFQQILKEYKTTFEEFREENQQLANIIKNLEYEIRQKELEYLKEKEKIRAEMQTEMALNDEKERELSTKLKDYEVMFSKMEFENQNYKESLHLLSRQPQSHNISVQKIDINNDYPNIASPDRDHEGNKDEVATSRFETLTSNYGQKKPYTNTFNFNSTLSSFNIPSEPNDEVKVMMNTTTCPSLSPNKNIEDLRIEDIANEIKTTENIIKVYSSNLKSQELELDKDNSNSRIEDNKQIFKEIMSILEMKTDYLFQLKKKYNFLIKKMNNF